MASDLKKVTSKNQARRDRDQAKLDRDEKPEKLPQLCDQLSVGMVLRFNSTGNFTGSTTITFQNLLDSWFVAGTATTAYQLFDYIKIKKVVIRAVNSYVAVGGNVSSPMAQVGVEFPGLGTGVAGGGKQAQDSAIGTNNVAMVSLKPDPMSQTAQYQYSSANTAFIVRARDYFGTALAGVVVDVHCVLRNSADINPAALANAVAGAQPGLLYFGGMDGKRLAATEWRSAFIPSI